jgi:hypothetical protein
MQIIKGEAIQLQISTGSEGSRRLGLPAFMDHHHMKVVKLSVLGTVPLDPHEISLLLILSEAEMIACP